MRFMSQHSSQIDLEMTVEEVMRRWPATIRVFIDFHMNCVGCPIAGFHTVAEACREHCVEPVAFLAALGEAAVAEGGARSVLGRRVLGNPEQPVRVA
jgi:hybrid cluster-associated redox disulfide protein